jgi:hypothetical protein
MTRCSVVRPPVSALVGANVKSVLLDVRVHSRAISFAQGTDLYIANLGDSRAVLGSRDCAGCGMVAVQLTVDLKPDVPSTPPHSPYLTRQWFVFRT